MFSNLTNKIQSNIFLFLMPTDTVRRCRGMSPLFIELHRVPLRATEEQDEDLEGHAGPKFP